MIHSLFDSTTIPVLEQVANFAQARHQVLAGNIANIDTPGYRTRDLSTDQFQQRLQQALTARDRGPAESGGATPGTERMNALDKVRDGLDDIVYHDESNVGVEQQVTELAKNQLQHNLALTILTSQFRLLQAAVSERA